MFCVFLFKPCLYLQHWWYCLIFVIWGFVHCFLYRFSLCMYSVCNYFSAALACNWLLSVVRHFNIIIVVTLLTLLALFFQVSVTVVYCSASLTSLTSCFQGNQRLTLYTHYLAVNYKYLCSMAVLRPTWWSCVYFTKFLFY
jgi:hypothetical protein